MKRSVRLLVGSMAGIGLVVSILLSSKIVNLVKAQSVGHKFTVQATFNGVALNHPTGLFLSPTSSGTLYIADTGANTILSFGGGTVGTIAGNGTAGYVDGTPSSAEFKAPTGIGGRGLVMRGDPSNPGQFSEWVQLAVVDSGNNVVRSICIPGVIDARVPPPCGTPTVTTLAGSGSAGYANGTGTSASFNHPTLTSNGSSTSSYVVDTLNHVIRAVSTSGTVTTFAGTSVEGFVDGPAASAQFNGPTKITADASGNLYVSDTGNFAIRKIDSSGNVTTFAGTNQQGCVDRAGTAALFSMPTAVAYNSADGYVYVVDSLNNCIRRIDSSGVVSTYAGTNTAGNVDGSLTAARFSSPVDLVIYQTTMYVSDMNNNSIRKIDMSAGRVSTLLH
jgi:hypothetical protein